MKARRRSNPIGSLSGRPEDAMAGENERGALFRVIVPNQHSRVTYAELLSDLVGRALVVCARALAIGSFSSDDDYPDRRGNVGINVAELAQQSVIWNAPSPDPN
jgi:hypothetical protein